MKLNPSRRFHSRKSLLGAIHISQPGHPMIPCKCVLRHFHVCTPTVNRLRSPHPHLGFRAPETCWDSISQAKWRRAFLIFLSNDFNESSHHQNSKRSSLGLSYRKVPTHKKNHKYNLHCNINNLKNHVLSSPIASGKIFCNLFFNFLSWKD